MDPYHKIPTLFERDPKTNHRTVIMGRWATPELEFLSILRWQLTEKIDGTNIRVMIGADGSVRFGGRTENSQIPTPLLDHLMNTFIYELTKPVADKAGGPVCLYGEGCGPGIQKHGERYGPDPLFVLFDVRVGDWWLNWDDVKSIARTLNIPVAPVITHDSLHQMVYMVQDGVDSAFDDFIAEGLVARPMVPLMARDGSRIICKLKTKDFDLIRARDQQSL